jgi:hypothetical protein
VKTTLVILEVAWGGGAPWFRINPRNHSGRRLYDLVGHRDLWVTNACPEVVATAAERGRPDAVWLKKNIRHMRHLGLIPEVLIVGGRVAAETYDACGTVLDIPRFDIPHPAWRGWTKDKIAHWKKIIQKETMK